MTLDELREVLGGEGGDEAIKDIIASADSDGNGEISFPEFAQMMLKLYKGQ